MQNDEVGYPAASGPSGAAGWDAFRSWGDRMEDTYGYDQLKTSVDNMTPGISGDMSGGLPVDWQGWGSVYGSLVQQDNKDGFAGYDSQLGGGVVGFDKTINNTMVGIGGGYAHTILEGYGDRDARANTGHAVAYFATHGKSAYLDASASYAISSVNTEFTTMGYEGGYNANMAGFYVGAGYGVSLLDQVMLTPEASILNTLYWRDSYTEYSSLAGVPEMAYDDYDQWSHLIRVGAAVNTVRQFNLFRWEMGLQPELRAYWLHELNAEMDDETYRLGGSTIGATPMAREEDLVNVGAGIRLNSWASDKLTLGIDADGTFGSDGYEAYILSGSVVQRF
jgi:outer membrane autotransporter protein